jgi:hypothetical protein
MRQRRLSDYGIGRDQLRQGGGRGNGNDHFDELVGSTEFHVYQTPGRRVKGFDSLKLYAEAEECELLYTAEAPPELSDHETLRITHRRADPIPDAVLKRAHSWAHRNNFLHSFFKPLYR